VDVKISGVKTELADKINETEIKLTDKINAVDVKISDVKTELTDKITFVHKDMKSQLRWFIGILVTLFGILISVMLAKGAL